jgi:hypothetical protein
VNDSVDLSETEEVNLLDLTTGIKSVDVTSENDKGILCLIKAKKLDIDPFSMKSKTPDVDPFPKLSTTKDQSYTSNSTIAKSDCSTQLDSGISKKSTEKIKVEKTAFDKERVQHWLKESDVLEVPVDEPDIDVGKEYEPIKLKERELKVESTPADILVKEDPRSELSIDSFKREKLSTKSSFSDDPKSPLESKILKWFDGHDTSIGFEQIDTNAENASIDPNSSDPFANPLKSVVEDKKIDFFHENNLSDEVEERATTIKRTFLSPPTEPLLETTNIAIASIVGDSGSESEEPDKVPQRVPIEFNQIFKPIQTRLEIPKLDSEPLETIEEEDEYRLMVDGDDCVIDIVSDVEVESRLFRTFLVDVDSERNQIEVVTGPNDVVVDFSLDRNNAESRLHEDSTDIKAVMEIISEGLNDEDVLVEGNDTYDGMVGNNIEDKAVVADTFVNHEASLVGSTVVSSIDQDSSLVGTTVVNAHQGDSKATNSTILEAFVATDAQNQDPTSSPSGVKENGLSIEVAPIAAYLPTPKYTLRETALESQPNLVAEVVSVENQTSSFDVLAASAKDNRLSIEGIPITTYLPAPKYIVREIALEAHPVTNPQNEITGTKTNTSFKRISAGAFKRNSADKNITSLLQDIVKETTLLVNTIADKDVGYLSSNDAGSERSTSPLEESLPKNEKHMPQRDPSSDNNESFSSQKGIDKNTLSSGVAKSAFETIIKSSKLFETRLDISLESNELASGEGITKSTSSDDLKSPVGNLLESPLSRASSNIFASGESSNSDKNPIELNNKFHTPDPDQDQDGKSTKSKSSTETFKSDSDREIVEVLGTAFVKRPNLHKQSVSSLSSNDFVDVQGFATIKTSSVISDNHWNKNGELVNVASVKNKYRPIVADETIVVPDASVKLNMDIVYNFDGNLVGDASLKQNNVPKYDVGGILVNDASLKVNIEPKYDVKSIGEAYMKRNLKVEGGVVYTNQEGNETSAKKLDVKGKRRLVEEVSSDDIMAFYSDPTPETQNFDTQSNRTSFYSAQGGTSSFDTQSNSTSFHTARGDNRSSFQSTDTNRNSFQSNSAEDIEYAFDTSRPPVPHQKRRTFTRKSSFDTYRSSLGRPASSHTPPDYRNLYRQSLERRRSLKRPTSSVRGDRLSYLSQESAYTSFSGDSAASMESQDSVEESKGVIKSMIKNIFTF